MTWPAVSGSACSCGCRLTEPHGMITSSPQLFPRPGRSSCTWVITLPQGHRVHLWFDALKMDGDSIIVRDGNDSSAPKITIIKSDDYKESIVSSGNNMYLFYKHNGHWTNGTRRGFTASYKTESRTESKWRNTCVRQRPLHAGEFGNAAFRKCSSNRRNLKTPALRFRVDGKHFENGAFRKRWRHDNHVISLSSNTNPKWAVIVAFSNFSGVMWTGPLENKCLTAWNVSPHTSYQISREKPSVSSLSMYFIFKTRVLISVTYRHQPFFFYFRV